MLNGLLLTILLANTAYAAEWQRVAYDQAGVPDKQPHLTFSDGSGHFANPGAADEAVRTHALGDRIIFEYTGLNPQAAYKAKLRFFSDVPRTLRVVAGESTVAPSLKLEAGKTLEQEVELPPAAAFASGQVDADL